MQRPEYYQNYHKHTSFSSRYAPDSPLVYQDYFKEAEKLAMQGIPQIYSTVEHGVQPPYFRICDDLENFNRSRKDNQNYSPIKFIFGVEAYWVEDRFSNDSSNNHIILLAKNDNGRKKINRAIYESFKTGYYYKNRMDLDILLSLPKDDIFVTSSCIAYWGKYANIYDGEPNWERIDEITLKLFNHFTDFYLEVQTNNTDKQKIVNKHIMELHYKYGIPIIAGTDSHVIREEQLVDRDDLLKSKKISYPEEEGWNMDEPSVDLFIERFLEQNILTEEEVYEAINNTNVILDFEDIILDRSLKVPVPKKYKHLPLADRNEVFKQILRDEWKAQKGDINEAKFDEYIKEIRNGIEEVIGCNMADYFLCNYEIMTRGQEEYGGILTPSGRGCFTEDALVHTKNDLKSIKDVKIGDYVVTKDGKFNKVLNTMSYKIEEELIQIQHLYGTNKTNPTICTLDHKILTREGWKQAKDLTKTDFVCVPKMKPLDVEYRIIDLNDYNIFGYEFDDNFIYERMGSYPISWDYSSPSLVEKGICTEWQISKFSDLSYEPKTISTSKAFKKILENIPFNSRKEYSEYKESLRIKKINRFITMDYDINSFIGLMYGDGFTTSKGTIGLAINTETNKNVYNREVFNNFVKKLGLENCFYENRSKTKRLSQLYINSNLINNFISEFLFKSEKGKDKIFNESLFNQNKNAILGLIRGLRESDGSMGKDGRISFDNNSTSLINAYKLLCLMTESGVNSLVTRKPYTSSDGYNCNQSYKLRIGKTVLEQDEDFYYLPVTKIDKLPKTKTTVYDITVENESNYLLNNMIVHNSGVGFYINKLMKFTKVDKVNSTVLMYPERFLTKERIIDSHQMPDIDHNVSKREPFIQAQKDVIGEQGTFDLVAYGTLHYKSAFKMYARAYNLDPQLANTVTKQIDKYESALKYADDEDKDLIDIFDYVDKEKYGDLIEGCQYYKGIVDNIKGHPCSTICSDLDVVEEIGVIMVKSETTKKEVWVAVIESGTIDSFGWLKQDYLIVDSIGLTYEIYKEIDMEPMTVNQLLDTIEHDDATWDIYKQGLTMCINQCEQPKSSQKVTVFAPRNISELTQFIAGIRPAFKSMYKVFESRQHFDYGIKAFDSLIQDEYCTSSFILYQETLMKVLGFAGFEMGETYTIIKAISKKKDYVINKAKSKFIPNFAKAIIDTGETEDKDEAMRLSEQVWLIVENSASYGFNCVSGDTKIMRSGRNGGFEPTVEEMYLIMHDKEYAIRTKHKHLREKYRRYGYGTSLSLCEDFRVRDNQIIDITPSGIRETYEVKTKSGKSLTCTDNHKFPTPNGEVELKNLKVGDLLYCVGKYEHTKFDSSMTNGDFEPNYPKVGQCGFQEKPNGEYSKFQRLREEKALHRCCCEECNKEYSIEDSFELHHKDNDRKNNQYENLEWLCNSCHKKAHYKIGRTKRMEKGLPTYLDEIVSIEFVKVQQTYNIEMADPNHTFTSYNGLVTSNSAHAYCMAIDSVTLAWQKAHYPLEFYKVALQWYTNKGNKDKVAKLKKEMTKRGFVLNPIKFGDDNREFAIDKENNYITQTMSSIKNMQKIVPDIMYELGLNKPKQLFKVFKDIKGTKINKASLDILIKLDYFREYGTIPYIRTQLKIYEEMATIVERFRTCKQLKKKECETLGIDVTDVEPCCDTVTPKMLKDIHNDKLMEVFQKYYPKILKDISSKYEYEEIENIDKMSYQAELMGYVDIVDPSIPDDIYIVESKEVNKYGTTFISIYQACSGDEIDSIKVNKKWYNDYPCVEGNILRCAFEDKKKTYMEEDENGKKIWIPTGEFEKTLKCYSIIDTI